MRANHELANITLPAEVVVYFGDDTGRLYQLDQWVPVLERLAEHHRVLLVLRDVGVLRALRRTTSLPAVFVRRYTDLMELYDAGDYKLCIYVNHGFRNLQSLTAPRMLHVHVNHGWSDKLSSFSNQVKGYDRVFVAGEAAANRYREALIEFDERKLVKVGRPQLDLTFPSAIPPSPRRTVLYAPTWEGDSATNNWTSVDRIGPRIVEQLLRVPDVRVVYKPHPRVPVSLDPAVAAGHARICELITRAQTADRGAGHHIVLDGNILSMFTCCDAMVTDISSVGLDFLYLRTAQPLFLTDRYDDRARLVVDSPLAEAVDIVDTTTVDTLAEEVAARLVDDARREEREKMRAFYFGDLQPGESSERFLRAVGELIALRDGLVAGRRRVALSAVED